MKGKATHTLSLLAPASSIEPEAAEMAIGDVTLATEETANPSQKLQKNHQGNKLTIQLGKEYPAGQKLQIAIDYVVTKPNQGAHFVIPDASEPSQPKMVWTQSEPEDARYWFPCFDSPNDRLTSEIVTVAPANFIVLSNGSLISKRENDDKTVTWHREFGKRHVSIVAISKETLLGNARLLAPGDIIGFTSRRASLDYYHTGLVAFGKSGELLLRHASQSRGRVVEDKMTAFVPLNHVDDGGAPGPAARPRGWHGGWGVGAKGRRPPRVTRPDPLGAPGGPGRAGDASARDSGLRLL